MCTDLVQYFSNSVIPSHSCDFFPGKDVREQWVMIGCLPIFSFLRPLTVIVNVFINTAVKLPRPWSTCICHTQAFRQDFHLAWIGLVNLLTRTNLNLSLQSMMRYCNESQKRTYPWACLQSVSGYQDFHCCLSIIAIPHPANVCWASQTIGIGINKQDLAFARLVWKVQYGCCGDCDSLYLR
jgi:hypothetical protein